jgi:hypothetical protein
MSAEEFFPKTATEMLLSVRKRLVTLVDKAETAVVSAERRQDEARQTLDNFDEGIERQKAEGAVTLRVLDPETGEVVDFGTGKAES